MKYLMLLIAIFTLTGCELTGKTEEPKTEIVYKTEYIRGVDPQIPERPRGLPMVDEEPEIYVITPRTLKMFYERAIMNSELSDKEKDFLIKNLENITKLAHVYQAFGFIGFKQGVYFDQARAIKEANRWMEEANARFKYVEGLDLTIVPDESSGKN